MGPAVLSVRMVVNFLYTYSTKSITAMLQCSKGMVALELACSKAFVYSHVTISSSFFEAWTFLRAIPTLCVLSKRWWLLAQVQWEVAVDNIKSSSSIEGCSIQWFQLIEGGKMKKELNLQASGSSAIFSRYASGSGFPGNSARVCTKTQEGISNSTTGIQMALQCCESSWWFWKCWKTCTCAYGAAWYTWCSSQVCESILHRIT